MFAKPVASLAALALAMLATSFASAAPSAPSRAQSGADAPARGHRARAAVEAAKKKRTALNAPHAPTARHTPARHAEPKAVVVAAPASASKAQHKPAAPAAPARGCQKHAVEVLAGSEGDTFPLANCDGRAAMFAAERLGILARPGGTPKPTLTLPQLVRNRAPQIAPGVRRVDYGLVERLQKVVDHFGKAGQTTRVVLVSGYRPSSTGSYHATARALDFRIDGISNEQLVAFCKTLTDTGCGYYPNSVFIHMDARDQGAGHVAWIDASGPGEAPRYVEQWPPPDRARQGRTHAQGDAVARLDHELPPLPSDDHPALPAHAAPETQPAAPVHDDAHPVSGAPHAPRAQHNARESREESAQHEARAREPHPAQHEARTAEPRENHPRARDMREPQHDAPADPSH